MTERVLRAVVATDGSASAGVALDLVAGIAWPTGSSIRVIQATQTGAALYGGPLPATPYIETEPLDAHLRQAAADTVLEARARLARPGLDVTADVVMGRPATAIVETAAAHRADLVVVGSRGHGRIESMLLGSVSAEVVHHATVPVLVARGTTVDRVVVAWDGSACARAAADLLTSWPIFARSQVHVVSVADVQIPWWSGFPMNGSSELQAPYAETVIAANAEHEQLARELSDELRAAGLAAEPELRDGDPATALIAAATAMRADLIVLGTHGRTGLAGLLLGGVARDVARHAPCSVLVVPMAKRPG